MLAASTLLLALLISPSEKMAQVGPGAYRPFYPTSDKVKQIQVGRYWLDRTPVTQVDYANFLKQHPEWQKGVVPLALADNTYLSGSNRGRQPVTHVSWFAARAYCEAQGKRLPTEIEWEFAAQASESSPTGATDPLWRQRILNWYARPSTEKLPEVGKSAANYWGIYDLHGLVWEWVDDFNSNMMSVDNRSEGDKNRFGFCGSGSLKASDKLDYATFMRQAFRSSLSGNFTTANLGFRCASGQADGESLRSDR